MKKLILLLTLLFSLTMFSQQVKEYNTMYDTSSKKYYDVESIIKYNYPGDYYNLITIQINEVSYNLYMIGKIENGYTEGGYQYKLINCITDYNESVTIQIFPKENITRIIFDSGLSVELSNY